MRNSVLLLAPALVIGTGVLIACSSGASRSGFESTPIDDGGIEGSLGFTPGVVPCEGLECKIEKCGKGKKTTLTGTVYDPAGSNPLYNVMVYIPGGTTPDVLPPIKDSTEGDGIACETCSSVVVNPLRSALSDGKGKFTLTDVPVENDVPIVLQVGKWRRMIKVDITKKCDANEAPDGTLTLPKNSKEGNMPQIAVTTGGQDALECLLRGVGIDDKEFVMGDAANGHVHLYKGAGGNMGPDATPFWTDASQLRKYDLVLLSCEGAENLQNKGGPDDDAPRGAMHEYLNSGGKVFATHFHYTWFQNSPEAEFRAIGSFDKNGTGGGTSGKFQVATTLSDGSPFPKGERMAEWLVETGASSTPGELSLDFVKNVIKTVNDPAVSWIERTVENPIDPASTIRKTNYFSFNTPLSAAPEAQCGRAVFTDLHVTNGAGPTNIKACAIGSGGLNAQQKALEFLFYDLSACVTDDKVPPQPPK